MSLRFNPLVFGGFDLAGTEGKEGKEGKTGPEGKEGKTGPQVENSASLLSEPAKPKKANGFRRSPAARQPREL